MNLLIFEPNKGCRKLTLKKDENLKINIGKSVKQGYGNVLLYSDFLPDYVALINYYQGDFYLRSACQTPVTVDNILLDNKNAGIKLIPNSFIKIGNKSSKKVSMIYLEEDIDNKWIAYNKDLHNNMLNIKKYKNTNVIYNIENIIYNGEKLDSNHFVPENGDLFLNKDYLFYCIDNNIYFSKLISKDSNIYSPPNKFAYTDKISSNEVAILMKDVSRYDYKKKWYRLKNVNLKIYKGRLVAVMGISGAGKSTLFDALLGELKLDSGYIKISGNTYGHVPQFSVLRKGNSVEDVMEFYASKKLQHMSKNKRQEKIDELLGKLNLSLFKKSLVGKLSGGQSRRLDIAVQLLNEPSVILMDEPDSGLDVKSCIELYEILYEITRERNSTILVITHNTHMACKYPYIDNLLFMASQGRICFYGEKEEALNYFNIDDLDNVYSEVEDNQDYYVEKYNDTIARGI